MPSRANRIAHLMCRVTDETLSPLAAGVCLRLRVGSGRATYHRYDPTSGEHRINFGALMVADKACPEACASWLSAREIRSRHYFGGVVSEANLLAHTCCHEFAHLIQTLRGQRLRGSVHNSAFYRYLDDLYNNGHADALRAALTDYSQSLISPVSTGAVTVKEQGAARHAFAPGDAVRFGREMEGRVLRVNRKTCTVEGTGPCRGRRYRVSSGLLEPAEE